jgi:hypothetical protein
VPTKTKQLEAVLHINRLAAKSVLLWLVRQRVVFSNSPRRDPPQNAIKQIERKPVLFFFVNFCV